MKILILSDDFPPTHEGGAGVIAYNIAKELFKNKEDVLIFTTTKEKNEDGKGIYDKLKVVKVFSNYNERWRAYVSIYNYPVLKRFEEVLKDFKPDIVHAHNIHKNISYAALKKAKRSGAKVFITMHDVMSFSYGKLRTKKYLRTAVEGKPNYKISFWDNLKMAQKRFNPLRNFLIRRYLKYADKIFAVSEALRDALENNGIKGAEVVYNGIAIKNWEINKELIDSFKEKFSLKSKGVILFGGRLSDSKGGKQLIESICRVKQQKEKTVLLVLGKNSDYGKKMEERVKEKRIDIKIVFTGWIWGEELKLAYKSSDIVIIPSVCFDSFPNNNLEAMACHKPVIATCFGGSREVVENKRTGFIINPFDISDVAEKITELLENHEKAEKMGEAGFKRVSEKFSLENQIEKLMIWYGKKI
jgi:glycosyltransferase involved in cell wall biosynthesis